MNKNIFIASRMKNIVERKAVIDVVHTLGHSPIFIEAEQMKIGEESKALMDNMINRADCMVIVIGDDIGVPDENLGGVPPFIYEISQFRNRLMNLDKAENTDYKNGVRCLVFQQTDFKGRAMLKAESEVSITMAKQGEESSFEDFEFHDYDDLAAKVHESIQDYWGESSYVGNSITHRLTISWSGLNQHGMLGKITSLLFTEHNLNVVRVSASSIDGNASINISVSPWNNSDVPEEKLLEQRIRETFSDSEIENNISETHINQIKVSINRDSPKPKFYFELRVLDVPGILNALCKVLFDQKMDIDDIRQRPILDGHKNQSIIILSLIPINNLGEDEAVRAYLQLESRLRNLVGVRAITSMRADERTRAGAVINKHLM